VDSSNARNLAVLLRVTRPVGAVIELDGFCGCCFAPVNLNLRVIFQRLGPLDDESVSLRCCGNGLRFRLTLVGLVGDEEPLSLLMTLSRLSSSAQPSLDYITTA
jgi:hypothetical protein